MHHPIFRDFEIPYERYVLWLSPPAFDTMKKIDPDIDYCLRPGHAKTFLIRDSVDSSRARFGQFEALTHAYREESLCYHLSCLLYTSYIPVMTTYCVPKLLASSATAWASRSREPRSVCRLTT